MMRCTNGSGASGCMGLAVMGNPRHSHGPCGRKRRGLNLPAVYANIKERFLTPVLPLSVKNNHIPDLFPEHEHAPWRAGAYLAQSRVRRHPPGACLWRSRFHLAKPPYLAVKPLMGVVCKCRRGNR
jgi:hypothetical protein